MSELWQEILQCALLGTARRQYVPPSEGVEPIKEALGKLGKGEGEKTILRAAALTSTYEKSGYEALSFAGEKPAVASKESMKQCSERACTLLREVLSGLRKSYLAEWLERAVQGGYIVPPELIPPLLDLARKNVGLAAKILQVTGKRGLWLCKQNELWANLLSASPEPDTKLWYEGNKQERVALLRTLRRSNPALARQLLEDTWKQDNGRDRTAFLYHLQEGLSADDCSFLEMAHNDKSKGVRGWANILLSQLPSSSLVDRMKERASVYLKGERKKAMFGIFGETLSIVATLPQDMPEDWARDGMTDKVQIKRGMGKRAWLLCQLIAAVPPSYWCEKFEMTPSEALSATNACEHQRAIILGWLKATENFKDTQWAAVLCARFLAEEPEMVSKELMAALTPSQRENIAIERMEAEKGKADDNYASALTYCQHAWSKEFTLKVLRLYLTETRWRTGYWPNINFRSNFLSTIRWWDPSVYDYVSVLLNKCEPDSHISGVHSFSGVLVEYGFRHDMYKELKK